MDEKDNEIKRLKEEKKFLLYLLEFSSEFLDTNRYHTISQDSPLHKLFKEAIENYSDSETQQDKEPDKE